MTTREVAAATAIIDNQTVIIDPPEGEHGISIGWRSPVDLAPFVLAAADAHDAAHGVHRVSLDDATVERAARALHAETHKIAICKCCHPLWDTERENVRVQYRNEARAVLAAAVGGDGE